MTPMSLARLSGRTVLIARTDGNVALVLEHGCEPREVRLEQLTLLATDAPGYRVEEVQAERESWRKWTREQRRRIDTDDEERGQVGEGAA